MPKKLLFVVHRYAPYPGGSEKNVQRLAEESVRQGHEVTVLTGEHKGDLNGVNVTSDPQILLTQRFDMIFVHGSCPMQDIVHAHAELISQVSPIYYLIVEPPKNAVCWESGMKHATWIGWGTSMDRAFLEEKGFKAKGHEFLYGVESCEGQSGFKERYGITEPNMYVSAGGFWPHKRHKELADAFREANVENTHLVLLGYEGHYGLPTQSKNVSVVLGASQQDVYDAMFEADLYILNSESEGYGLVLLEAMANGTPWIATDIAAAHDLSIQGFGTVYHDTNTLKNLLRTPPELTMLDTYETRDLVLTRHSIENSVKNLLSVLI
jgi:glycosyltransferase involved in cell wall biosynthesis